jgi:hypothetical protein
MIVYCLVYIAVVVLCILMLLCFCTMGVLLLSNVYLLYYVCIVVVTLDAGLLARSQYSEGPATGHLETGFSWFPCDCSQDCKLPLNASHVALPT